MRVFVTGASGFVGTSTVRALVAAGHSVVGLVRRPIDDSESVTYRIGSITADTSEILAGLMDGCDAIVHLIGIIVEDRAAGETFERVHVHGTRNVIAAAEKASLIRFVYVSAVGASESAPAEYARTKAHAEAAVRDSRIPYTIFRPSIILGPGSFFLSQIERLIEKPPLSPIRLPFVPVPGDGQNRFQPLFIDDLTHCLTRCLSDPKTANQTYAIGGADEVTFDEVIAAVEQRLGIRKSLLHAPMPLMYAVAALLESILPRPPITTDQLINLGIDNVCDNDPVREAFGFALLPFSEVIRWSYGGA